MVYDPTTALNFNYTCYYTPPPGNCLEIRLGDFPQVCAFFRPQPGGSIVFTLEGSTPGSLEFSFSTVCCPAEQIPAKCEEIRPYNAPVGTVDFDFYKAYDWPLGTVNLDLADCAGDDPPVPPPEPPPWYEIPSGISPNFAAGFQRGTTADTNRRSSWNDANQIEPQRRAGWGQAEIFDRLIRLNYSGLTELFTENRMAFDRLLRTDNAISAAWLGSIQRDSSTRAAYDAMQAAEKKVVSPYNHPGPKDEKIRSIYLDHREEKDSKITIPWGSPPPNDTKHRTRWGRKWYEEICIRKYIHPAGTLNFNLDTGITNVGDKTHIDFWFESLSYDERCSHQEPSGWRDPFTYIPPIIYPQTPQKRHHLHMNSALLKRVSDNMPLDLHSFSAKINFGSFVWEFSAKLNSWASFDAVEPSEIGYHEVEANINGYLFRFLVEKASSSEDRKGNYTIAGRGLAAELSSPYAPKSSYTEELARNARQLIEDRLTGTGWTLDWQITDFLVPADVYTFHNLTPLEAIAKITGQVGARIQAHRINKVLQILPRYPLKPWTWDSETPALGLSESVILTAARDWQPGPNYNGVVVSGTTQGIIAKVMRTSSGGTKLAPMVTDPLIVTTEAATQRGIYEIAQSGNWQPGTFNLPLKTEPELPGLLLPGTLLQANRARENFRCQVTGVTVSARRQKGLKVRQFVEVERYRGEPVA